MAMLIDSFVNERLDWPLAGAASIVLLAATLAVAGAGGPLRHARHHRHGAMKLARNIFAAAMAAFLLLPVLAIVPAAFGARSYLQLPPAEWSLRWWGAFAADASWRQALATSLLLAGLTVLLSLAIGIPAALGIARLPGRWGGVATAAVMGPAVVPAIVLAVALYAVARGSGLVGTLLGLALGAHHAGAALCGDEHPRLVADGGSAAATGRRRARRLGLARVPHRDAAADPARASPARPPSPSSPRSTRSCLSVFLAGPQAKTLPVRMWEEIRVELTPVIAVAATVMIGLVARRWAR